MVKLNSWLWDVGLGQAQSLHNAAPKGFNKTVTTRQWL
ncbi:MAG: hypothetical protein HW388_1687 [Dehalococcoidia bacterium]|nr:hypothetical protein [Dehalococcoidia bacterium]